MNVKKLSDETGVKLETIRYYRNLGLLKPTKRADNGYWDYHPLDKLVLFHLRLLRSENISLEAIHSAFEDDKTLQEIQDIDLQIEELNRLREEITHKIYILEVARAHLLKTPDLHQITEEQVSIDKYVFTQEKFHLDIVDYCTSHLVPFSMSIVMDTCLLNDNLPEEGIPVRFHPGFYENDLPRSELKELLEKYHYERIPSGRYLMTTILCENLCSLPLSLLLPIQRYAKEHQYRFTGKTASFITNVDYSGPRPKLYVRLRLEVQEEGMGAEN